MKLIGLQIGTAQKMNLGARQLETGILKTSVASTKIMRDPETGSAVIGDTVTDNRHHGGPDQAVYVYFQEDYDWFTEQLSETPAPGTFGENFTIAGMSCQSLNIGDRLLFQEIILEITSPRIPCDVFANHMSDLQWVKKFRAARRPGVYCRVIQAGTAHIGEDVKLQTVRNTNNMQGLLQHFDLHYDTNPSIKMLHDALATPVAIRGRTALTEKLKQLKAKQ